MFVAAFMNSKIGIFLGCGAKIQHIYTNPIRSGRGSESKRGPNTAMSGVCSFPVTKKLSSFALRHRSLTNCIEVLAFVGNAYDKYVREGKSSRTQVKMHK